MCADFHYTAETNVQIVVALMKHHGVRRVIASPGTTNITLVASLQQDPYFEIYSSVDERSAAYMACGMAAETGEPVALSCTGATASRNYLSGLTEAFYRKLPVLAITSTQHQGRVGQMVPQVIDRSIQQKDVCRLSVQVPSVHDEEDLKACELAVNRALLALRADGGGPAHINLVTTYNRDFSAADLPSVRAIDIVSPQQDFPSLEGKRVAIYVGAHRPFDQALTEAVDAFCSAYDAVVVCDQTSNYHGAFRVLGGLLLSQAHYAPACKKVDVMIHVGEVSGAYYSPTAKEVWRVSPDGEVHDPFGGLRYVFDMGEAEFFSKYVKAAPSAQPANKAYQVWLLEDESVRSELPELPFSNVWCASQLAPILPDSATLHLGILNTLRSWNMFDVSKTVDCYCNTGGFGIDGCVSAMLGASMASPGKLFFGIVGDLACFYDLNSLGNRHVGPNVRLMVVNNGVGTEFKNYNHFAANFGEDADDFIAAKGHFGAKSPDLLRHYAIDLGFEYICAANKEEFAEAAPRFADPQPHDRPMLFEVFTEDHEESQALYMLKNIKKDSASAVKAAVKGMVGDDRVKALKKILGR